MKNLLAAVACSLALSSAASAAPLGRVEFTKGEAYRAAKACADGKCGKKTETLPGGTAVVTVPSEGKPRPPLPPVTRATGLKTAAVPYAASAAARERRAARSLLARALSFVRR